MGKIQYSKILPIVTSFIFIGITAYALLFNIDTSVAVSAVGIAGGAFGSSVIFYLRKAQSENVYKIQIGMYSDTIEKRLYFNEQMMILKKKYDVTDEEVEEINEQSDIDEMMDDALSNIKSTGEDNMSEANTPIEIQNY